MAHCSRTGVHLEVFVENRIEVDVLEHLTEVDLRKMGLPIGSVRRFLAAVQPQGQGGEVKEEELKS